MPHAGPTLMYGTGMNGRSPWNAEPARLSPRNTMTKDDGGAAVPNLRYNNNSNKNGPGKSQSGGFAAQDALYSTQPLNMSEGRPPRPIADSLSVPQQHASLRGTSARVTHPLPQRPEPLKAPLDTAQMSQHNVCRDFLAGTCRLGDNCRRFHPVQAYSISPSIRVVNGFYKDRMSNLHSFRGDMPIMSPSGAIADAANSEGTARGTPMAHTLPPSLSLPPPPRPYHPPRHIQTSTEQRSTPPTTRPEPTAGSSTEITDTVVEPEDMNVERLMRAAELDPRPSRRLGQVCQLYQKGLCLYGDRCHRTHIFLVPDMCISELPPLQEKPQRQDDPVGVADTTRRSSVAVGPKRDVSGHAFRNAETVGSPPARDTAQTSKQPREVCRLYFQKKRCFKTPCKRSHDLLDLAKLPADDDLVVKHADQIREALESQKVTAGHKSDPSSSLPSTISDSAKKRPRKPPRKPGAVDDDFQEEATAASKAVSGHADFSGLATVPGQGGSLRPAPSSASGRSCIGFTNQVDAIDHDDCSSEASHHSARDTTYQEYNSSPSVRDDPRSKLPCFQYIHGRCEFRNCKFSHNIDREAMRREFLESSQRERLESLTEGRFLPDPERHRRPSRQAAQYVATGSRNNGWAVRDTLEQADDSVRRQNPVRDHQLIGGIPNTSPAVPPGLGLENGTPRGPQSRPPPEVMTIKVLDSTKVTFGPGFFVQTVVTGFECLQVILENVPSHVLSASIASTLEPFGRVTAIQPSESSPGDSTIAYKITFSTGDAAAEAAAAMNGRKLFGVEINAHLAEQKLTTLGRGTLYDGDVLFELPTPFLIGFVGYPTEELARKAIALAAACNIGYSRVTAELYTGIPAVGMYNVRFRGLPPNFTVDDIRKHFVNPLIVVNQDVKRAGKRGRKRKGKDKAQETVEKQTSGDEQSEEACEGIMLQRAKYQSLNGAFHGLRRMLEQFDEDVSINVVPPPYGRYVHVWGHFTSPDTAARACETLHRFRPHFVAKEQIFARHIKTLRYALSPPIYDVLAPEIDLLRSYIRDDAGTSISVFDKRNPLLPNAPVNVKLLSESMRSLTKAKAAFDRLLRGEKVTDNGQVVWNDFFGGQGGESFLRDLERKYPRVRISSDFRRRTLALFGVPDERERVRKEIIAKDKELRSRYTHRYPIPGDRIAGFMREGLAMLQKELGRENVWVDLTNQKLIVRGEEDAQKVAQLAVLHARQRAPRQGLRNGAACPVCFGEVSQPVALSCGHTWCKDCLAGYLNASVGNKSFPITCLADEARCAHPISLSIAQRLLSTEEFDAIVHAAFTSYVQERPKEFHYCPTPDCPQVYRKMARKTKSALQCPSCLVRICPHCNMEYHESVSCQDRDPEAEMLFEEWKMGRDVKDCPNCKVPIERSAGCNHMTCASCKTHICWACLATFTTSGEVYEHMRTIHGGIGL
ncbi:hypothetical protein PYCCODRAFT_1402404 [Trametes coccinea BRFM310]|uniref:RBR-type E3 ubiquitin transferase n=1 Tax=Trametes coccinea (strain BRFM310) TaxID=1353009 RepID=A0A1Y2J5U4_TRAC3|nr:hypothetical protein PYCCODRAFT_1402404 [Trametes coccinea BRFM310]